MFFDSVIYSANLAKMKTSIIAIAVAGISLSGAVPLALTPRQAPLSDGTPHRPGPV